jgi:REase_DpnII-MboI
VSGNSKVIVAENSRELSLRIDARIELLREFREYAYRWYQGKFEPEGQAELRTRINKTLIPARMAVVEAGAMKLMTIGPPPAIGGVVPQNLDPFQNFFANFYGISLIGTVIDAVDQAIGVYEQALGNSDLVNLESKDALDIETAIERALRPSFRRQPPTNETEVQDAIEDILNAVGVDFIRDKEVAPVGQRASRPDLTIEAMSLAIEFKLAKENHGASDIQQEMNADITVYKTKWNRLMFVIYDVGVVADPRRMIRENQRLFGISVLVIKH